jgi:hypothetical protein
MSLNRQSIPYLIAISLLLIANACKEHSSPTDPGSFSPPSSQPPSATALWTGQWTFERAEPGDNCMAQGLNNYSHTGYAPMTLKVERTGGTISLDFWAGLEDDVGYLPGTFVGTVDEAGHVVAVPQPYPGHNGFVDPYHAWCYSSWSVGNGTLIATLSADQREISGTIVESFGSGLETFTVHSRFVARAR